MTSRKQIEANRNNAKQSTGPRTNAGKQRSSQNAVKHGLLAKQTLIPGENPADFEALLSSYEDTFQPANPVEDALVRQIADAEWRLRRVSRLEAAFLNSEVQERRRYRKSCDPNEVPRTDTKLLGEIMQYHAKDLTHFVRYHAHFSRRYFQAIKQLEEFREMERRHIQRRFEEEGIEDRVPRPAKSEHYWPAQAPDPPPNRAVTVRERSSPRARDISTERSQTRITPTSPTTSAPNRAVTVRERSTLEPENSQPPSKSAA